VLVLVLLSYCSIFVVANRPQKVAQAPTHNVHKTEKLASSNRKQQHHADLHAMVAAQGARASAPVTHRQSASVAKKAPAVAVARARGTPAFRETAKSQKKAVLTKSGAHVAAKLSAAQQMALHSDLLCGEGQAGDCAPQESCFFPGTRFDTDDATCKQLGVTYGCCYHRVHSWGDGGLTYFDPIKPPAPRPAIVVTAGMSQIYAAPCGNDANIHSGQCLNEDDCQDYHDGTSIDTDGRGGSGCVAGRICCNTKTPQQEPWSQVANSMFDHSTDKLNELGNGVVMTDTLPGASKDLARTLSQRSAATSTSTAGLSLVFTLVVAALVAAF